ncbi:hypothetical protein [Nonomuraea lactucae]|uniref:hypothetical protein n=1 Tax=Nonomuraea lactucae TaxID=2249762 RepID=UPI000DE53327|nr:hypothetical protein [Nonomuraea lactucae]
MKRLLFEASASVDATVEQVRALIDSGWVIDAVLSTGTGSGDDADADSATARSYVDVDHREGVVGFQGHWWYRGELSASASEGRTVITYRVFNIARRGAWAVPLANRFFIGYDRAVRQAARGVAEAIERHLAEATS